MKNIKWGEFRIGDLFDIQNTLSFNKDKLTIGNQYDYITRTSKNQGILTETGFVNEENINSSGNWSLGLLQMNFFYRKKPWYAGQFVRKVVPKIKLDKNLILFFTVVLNKQRHKLLSVLVRDVDKTFLNTFINLPVFENGKIDFDFMKDFITELETQHITELETYLIATGLKDYQLKHEEEKILEDFQNGNIEWGEFRIGDLFAKIEVKPLKYKASNLPSEAVAEFILPALTAGIQNQGLNNFVPKTNATILKNVISISANGACGSTFFQSRDFTILQDAYAIRWIDINKSLSNYHYLYLTAAISKTLEGKYGWGFKSGWQKVRDEKIFLPIRNSKIDFDFMESFVSVIQKLVIKNVVLYTERKIKTMKEAIGIDQEFLG